jgi:hypothetical protein
VASEQHAEDRKVVSIESRSRRGDPPLRRRRDQQPRFCRHKSLELDTEARRVYCVDCDQEVPAFDALLNFERYYDRYVSTCRRAQREAEAAEERLEELKREERNTKARIRRAQDAA